MKREPLGLMIKKLILGITVLLISVMVGYLLLVLAYCIPIEKMQDHMRESCVIFEKEGTYPKVMWNYNSRLDNFSDAFMLMMAAYDSDESPWKAALHSSMYSGLKPDEVFVNIYGKGSTEREVDSYSRFWHGYEILIKPLLCIMNYHSIRILMAIVQCLLIGILIYNLYRFDRRLILPVIGMWVFLNPVAISMSMHLNTLTTVTIVMLTAMIMLMRKKDVIRMSTWDVFFLIAGFLTNYFGMLSYPLLSWGVLLNVWLFIHGGDDLKDDLWNAVELSMFWGIGYAGTWMSKWLLSLLVNSDNAFRAAAGTVGNYSGEDGRLVLYAKVLLRNIGASVQVIVAVYVVVLIAVIIRLMKKHKYAVKPYICYIIIMFIPFAWYFVTGSHAYIHYWFTYRNMGISIMALHLIMIKMKDAADPEKLRQAENI